MRFSRLAVLSLLYPAAAIAQTPAPVTGRPEVAYSDAQRVQDEETSRRYVQTMLANAYGLDTQYVRWNRPVCFGVYGLAPATTHALQNNLMAIARKVGAAVDRATPCDTNISIVFTATPQETLDGIARTRAFLASGDTQKPAMTRPIQVWYSNFVHDYQGKRIKDASMGDGIFFQLTDRAAPAMVDSTGQAAMRMRANVTHLSTGIISELENAIILVDSKAVADGMSIGSLSDYLAMTALAQVRTDGRCRDIPSIANLLAEGCDKASRPAAMTAIDLAMLSALYQTALEPERLHQQRIVAAMRQNLEKQPAR